MHGLYIDEALLNIYFKTTFNTNIEKCWHRLNKACLSSLRIVLVHMSKQLVHFWKCHIHLYWYTFGISNVTELTYIWNFQCHWIDIHLEFPMSLFWHFEFSVQQVCNRYKETIVNIRSKINCRTSKIVDRFV